MSLVKVDGKDAFVLSTIPAAVAKDQSIQTRTLFSESDLSFFRVVGVFGGYIIALKQPFEFLAFDMTTGAKKQLSRAACENAILTNGHLYYVVATGKSGSKQEICSLTGSGAGMLHFGKDFTFAATSDGSKIAVTEMVTDSNRQSFCRIVMVDGRTKEVTRSPLSTLIG